MSSPQTIVLITGANAGLGYAAAKVILQASPTYHVIVGSRSSEKGEAAVQSLQETLGSEASKDRISALRIDVTDEKSIKAAAEKVASDFGRVDVLINNAGVAPQGFDADTVNSVFATNMTGPLLVSRAFSPLLLKSKNAYSIFVTSGLASLAWSSDPSHPIYSSEYLTYRMSKAGLNMLVTQVHKEYKDKGVKVFAICPGLLKSGLRGKEEAQISAGGKAGEPERAGEQFLEIMEGKFDHAAGKFIKDSQIALW